MFAILLVNIPTDVNQQNLPYEETFVPGLVPPPIPMSVFLGDNQVQNMAEASTAMRKNVEHPRYLPSNYKVQLISATQDEVRMYASPSPLTPATTDQDFVWKQKGITIIVSQADETEVAEEVKQVLALNPEAYSPVQIGNKMGAGHEIIRFDNGDGIVGSAQAELLYYGDGERIVVHGLHPLERLISVAVSLTE